MRTKACLECLAATRGLVGDTPLVPMTYASLLEAYGWERIDDRCPYGRGHRADRCRSPRRGAPRDSAHPARRPDLDRRADRARRTRDGRLACLVTLTGTTGARDGAVELAGRARRTHTQAGARPPALRRVRDLHPDHARATVEHVDGIVVARARFRSQRKGPRLSVRTSPPCAKPSHNESRRAGRSPAPTPFQPDHTATPVGAGLRPARAPR